MNKIPNMLLSPEERNLIQAALGMWINYIQTGDVTLSQGDAVNMKQLNKIKVLSMEQMKMILQLDELRIKILSGEEVT